MKYEIGGIIISKKQHACGAKEWRIERLGADIKLKCQKCGRYIFLLPDKVNKICAKYIPNESCSGENNECK